MSTIFLHGVRTSGNTHFLVTKYSKDYRMLQRYEVIHALSMFTFKLFSQIPEVFTPDCHFRHHLGHPVQPAQQERCLGS